MNKNVIGAVIAIVAILGIVGVVLANKDDSPAPASTSQNANTSPDMAGMDMKSDSPAAATGSDGEQDLTGQTEVTMDIKDFAFAKKSVKVSKGTKITWTNRDDSKHNVVSKDNGGPNGPLLSQGENYSFTFDTVGTFNYICEPHPYMKGSVSVVE